MGAFLFFILDYPRGYMPAVPVPMMGCCGFQLPQRGERPPADDWVGFAQKPAQYLGESRVSALPHGPGSGRTELRDLMIRHGHELREGGAIPKIIEPKQGIGGNPIVAVPRS